MNNIKNKLKKMMILSLTLASVFLYANYDDTLRAQVEEQPPAVSLVTTTSEVVNHPSSGTINVQVEGASDMGSYTFDVKYDPAVIKIDEVEHGSFLSSTGNSSTPNSVIDNTNGITTFGAYSVGSNAGPSGSGVLDTLHFSTVGAGATDLAFDYREITKKSTSETLTPSGTGITLTVRDSGNTGTPTSIVTEPPSTITSSVVRFDFDIRMDGITKQTDEQDLVVRIKDGATTRVEESVVVSSDTQGVYSGTVNAITGTYKVCFDAKSHLQKCFSDVTFTTGSNTYSWTDSKGDQLRLADTNSDNKLTIEDYAEVASEYNDFVNVTDLGDPRDVNHDSVITIDDLALVVINYNDFEIPGDE